MAPDDSYRNTVVNDLDWLFKNKLAESFRLPPYTLLTGAGFTAGVDGFLTDQMWEQIFNQPQICGNDALRKRMQDDFNFERIYDDLFRDKDQELFRIYALAVAVAYDRLDYVVRRAEQTGVDLNGLRSWLSRFGGQSFSARHKGVIFSLNQDLFLERLRKDAAAFELRLPGLQSFAQAQSIADHDGVRKTPIPKGASAASIAKEFGTINLLKLHGSCNWVDIENRDVMVIGAQKPSLIGRYHLLKAYFELFEYVLNSDGMSLWVFGYGFKDPHINQVIANAVRTRGLKIFVVDKCRPNAFFDRLAEFADHARVDEAQGRAQFDDRRTISKAINAFIPNSIAGIFQSGYTSIPYQQIDTLMFEQQRTYSAG